MAIRSGRHAVIASSKSLARLSASAAWETVLDASAPGGARFEPELINNASGAGSQLVAVNVNDDGLVDVLTTGANGSFIFFGEPR